MITAIFCEIDDFCKFLGENDFLKLDNADLKRVRKRHLKLAEILTIQVFFHYSDVKNFKAFYTSTHFEFLKKCFPGLVSYTRFLELKNEAAFWLLLFSKWKNQNASTGISFIDSTCIKVAHSRREKRHKIFKNLARKGKTSVGWFYGLKLHLVITHLGEVIDFEITSGNVADNNKQLIDRLTDKVKGILVGDKGYIGRAADLIKNGIRLLHRSKSNMKKTVINSIDLELLKSRGVIESVIGVLKEKFSLEHSRHRSVLGGLAHIAATLIAYAFKPKKPSISSSMLAIAQLS